MSNKKKKKKSVNGKLKQKLRAQKKQQASQATSPQQPTASAPVAPKSAPAKKKAAPKKKAPAKKSKIASKAKSLATRVGKLPTAIKETSKDKYKELAKKVNKTVSVKNISKQVFKPIKAQIATELPEIAALAGSASDFIGKIWGKTEDKKKTTPTGSSSSKGSKSSSSTSTAPTLVQPQPTASQTQSTAAPNNSSNPSVLNSGAANVALSRILAVLNGMHIQLQTATDTLVSLADITRSVKEASELQLGIAKKSLEIESKNKKDQKFKQQTTKANALSALTGTATNPPKDKKEKSFLEKLMDFAFFRFLFAGIAALLPALVGIGTTIAGIVASMTGLSALLGSGALGAALKTAITPNPFNGSKGTPAAPTKTPAKSATTKAPSKFSKAATKVGDGAKSLMSKAGSAAKSSGSKALQLGKGALATTARGAVAFAPQIAVGAGAGAVGAGIGYGGLTLVDKGVDKITGKENTIGEGLLKLADKLSGKKSMTFSPEVEQRMKMKEEQQRSLSAAPRDQLRAANMMVKQKENDMFDTASKAASLQQGSAASVTNAPMTNNVTNTNVISKNMLTRNPDGFLIASGLISF